MISINKLAGSQHSKNVTYQISGWPSVGEGIVLRTEQPSLKLAAATWLIEEKMGLLLSWDSAGNQVLFPAESRNSVKFDPGMPSPKDWDGTLYGSYFNRTKDRMSFLLMLDFNR